MNDLARTTAQVHRLSRPAAGMDWSDYDFVLESAEEERPRLIHLTGWETVIFDLDDELPPPDDE